MYESRIFAPFLAAALIAGTGAYATPGQVPATTTIRITLAAASAQSAATTAPWTGEDLEAAFLARVNASYPGLVDVIRDSVAVYTDLAAGQSLTEVLAEFGPRFDAIDSDGEGVGFLTTLTQTRELLLIAPTVVDGSLTISAAVPGAFAQLFTAFTAGFTNVVAAAGTPNMPAAVRAARNQVVSAFNAGLNAIAPVVQQVSEEISAALASLPIEAITPPASVRPASATAAETAGNARVATSARAVSKPLARKHVHVQ
ncbi:hypothetical protein [Mycolicibacterium sphagni]|uniref:PE domain-containing protein n=1 Tax=Mycolicibacterium sphagni TaxID=1786 RepID=A0A255D796_9MYCO|nr:hypothetical protein [Mycolicibacterium sphagni]OYN75198.1 hypothetical protein CG716_26170 [Mycolicibacterium sphagni]